MKDLKFVSIFPENTIKFAMNLINQNGFGSLIVINKKKYVLGTLTDGDIRRALFKGKQLNEYIKKIYQRKIFKVQHDKVNLNILEKKSAEKNLNIIPIVKKKKLIDFFSTRTNYNQNKSIQTVIMAGGLGTRMRPFTNIFPKPMLPINDKTMIEVVIEQFIKFNLKNFIFTINYKSDLLSPYLKNLSKKIKINYKIIKEKQRLGTAGSLKFFKKKIKSDFFVTNCDTILKANLNEVYEFHKHNKNDITIVAAIKNETIPYGILKVNKKQNFTKIYEKPNNSYMVNTGVYVLNPKILKHIPSKEEIFDMNQLILLCKEKKCKIKVFLIDGDLWHDVGQITNYQKFVSQENG